jgi:hypothetical protein
MWVAKRYFLSLSFLRECDSCQRPGRPKCPGRVPISVLIFRPEEKNVWPQMNADKTKSAAMPGLQENRGARQVALLRFLASGFQLLLRPVGNFAHHIRHHLVAVPRLERLLHTAQRHAHDVAMVQFRAGTLRG